MSILGDLLTGKLRQEMRERVDEIITYGKEWIQTAQKLTEAINNLTEEIRKGNVNPKSLKSLNRTASKLAQQTANLTKALISHNETLQKILSKIG